jgi:diguanylate cyclase (GGDEF)-like protein
VDKRGAALHAGTMVVGSFVHKVGRWFFPTPPAALRVEVERRQLMRIRAQLPMLYLVASLNVVIIMAVCAHNDVPLRLYGWLAGLIVLAAVRTASWLRSKQAELPPTRVTSVLRRSTWISGVMLFVLGVFTAATFVAGTFARSTLMPISLAFGSMAIAHCFATVRASAVGAIVFGVVVSAVAMLVTGDFDARVLAVSMLSIAGLMMRFVAGQCDQLVTEVKLQREVYDLANTDSLTQLPNRRSAMAMLAAELSVPDNVFGVGLVDLDGFKAINDRLGHLTGDALLQVVAQRLTAGSHAGDAITRLGGDEFLVLCRGVRDRADAEQRCASLLLTLCRPTTLAGEAVDVRGSLGMSLCPADGRTPAELLAAADAALYAVKRRGGPSRVPDLSEDRRRHRSDVAV